jgi:hypothetical protein
MRGVRVGPQPSAGTMSPRPVSAPLLLGEQRERVRQWTASPVLPSREFSWGERAPDEPGVEVLT